MVHLKSMVEEGKADSDPVIYWGFMGQHPGLLHTNALILFVAHVIQEL